MSSGATVPGAALGRPLAAALALKAAPAGRLRGAVAGAVVEVAAMMVVVAPSYEWTDRSEAERPSGGVEGRKGLQAAGHDGRAMYS